MKTAIILLLSVIIIMVISPLGAANAILIEESSNIEVREVGYQFSCYTWENPYQCAIRALYSEILRETPITKLYLR